MNIQISEEKQPALVCDLEIEKMQNDDDICGQGESSSPVEQEPAIPALNGHDTREDSHELFPG
jgi:hypothetical protein